MAFMWIFYRSDNAISNDYLYHNIGDSVALYTQDGKVLKQDEVLSYPCVGEDHPGLRYFRSVRTTGRNESTVVALFSAKLLNTGTSYMKMWMPASSDVSYFTAFSTQCENRFISLSKQTFSCCYDAERETCCGRTVCCCL